MENDTLLPLISTLNIDTSDVIDLFEYRDLDGKVNYIDSEELNSNYQKNMEELDDVINQLRKYSEELKNGVPDFGLNDSSKDDINSNPVFVDLDKKSTNSYSYKNKFHKFKMNLVRTAVMAGVILGLSAASKSSPNLGVVNSYNQSISIENDTKTVTNNFQKLDEKTIKNKTSKKSKQRLGFIRLNNTKLSYTSMNSGPIVNTKDLKCDSYKAHYAAILDDNNNLMDVIDVSKKQNMNITKFKRNCKKVYGDNISIKLNVDGIIDGKIVYSKAGWVSIEKSIKSSDKSYTKCI